MVLDFNRQQVGILVHDGEMGKSPSDGSDLDVDLFAEHRYPNLDNAGSWLFLVT